MVNELVNLQGQIVLAVSLGKEHCKKKLPFKHYSTGETEMLPLGKFFGMALQESMMRDLQTLNLLFTELLPYNITPKDRVLSQNNRTIVEFFKEIKAEKLKQIKHGKIGTDLFTILLTEGGHVYGED